MILSKMRNRGWVGVFLFMESAVFAISCQQALRAMRFSSLGLLALAKKRM
jgi:hypothetical protein